MPDIAMSIPPNVVEVINTNLCRSSLKAFVATFWHIVEPSTPLIWNWHLDELCDVLEAVTRGEVKRLIINIPPGTGKSLIVSVFHIAWEWASSPGLRHLSASYSSDNTVRDNRRIRDIVTSDKYVTMFWSEMGVTLSSDQYAKVRIDTTAKGYSIATSVGGIGTGEHPDRIRIDDPHKLKESGSSIKRDDVGTWFTTTISTRKAADPAIIIIMQRANEDDLCGRLLPTGTWEHLLFPMRYEIYDVGDIDSETKKQLGSWDCPCHAKGGDLRDVRTKPGELLFPALFDEEAVRQLEADLGPFEASGQLQQRPTPISGGLFKRVWFIIVDVIPSGRILWGRGWDTAASENVGAFSVGTKMGKILNGPQKDKFVIDIDAEIREQAEDIDPYITQTAKLDGRRVRVREEQEPGGSGKKVIASHTKMLAGYDYEGTSATGDKVTKARPFRVQCQAGNVLLYGDVRNINDWLDEVCGFPLHKYKDRVDSASIIFNSLALEERVKTKRAMVVGGRMLRKALKGMRR